MEEAENQDSQQEVISPTAEVQQDAQQAVPEQKDAPAEESDWIRNLRKDRKDALRRADEAERRSRMQDELMQKLMAQQASPQVMPAQEEDIIHEISKEEYVPGEKVAKGFKKLEEKFDRRVQAIERHYEEKHKNSLINDLKREFSDFADVVNPETIAILEESNPRLANAIASSKDPYLMAVQTYEYIKAKGLSNKAPISKRVQETEAKIEQNKKTVQSPQAFEKRPMAAAFKMTDAMKDEVAKEMYHYANQAGMGY